MDVPYYTSRELTLFTNTCIIMLLILVLRFARRVPPPPVFKYDMSNYPKSVTPLWVMRESNQVDKEHGRPVHFPEAE